MEINKKVLQNILYEITELEKEHDPSDTDSSTSYQENLIIKILEMDKYGNYSQEKLDHLIFLKNNGYIYWAGFTKTNDLTPLAIESNTEQRQISIAAPLYLKRNL